MLDPEELASVSGSFGASEDQVIKDHLISHVLYALARSDQPVTFFGGTALHRCYFPSPDVGGRLQVPTPAAFAAMKTCAWIDRRAARDLYDLAALARQGALSVEAAALVHEVMGYPVAPHFFDGVGDLNWHRELAHQMPDLPPMSTCLAEVRSAYGDALRWEQRGDTLG